MKKGFSNQIKNMTFGMLNLKPIKFFSFFKEQKLVRETEFAKSSGERFGTVEALMKDLNN